MTCICNLPPNAPGDGRNRGPRTEIDVSGLTFLLWRISEDSKNEESLGEREERVWGRGSLRSK